MTPLRAVAIVLLVAGLSLVIAGIATPTCVNYAGTARDSGYPCKIDRSSGMTDFVLSRSTTVSVPLSAWLGIGLVVVGGVMLGRSARSRGSSTG